MTQGRALLWFLLGAAVWLVPALAFAQSLGADFRVGTNTASQRTNPTAACTAYKDAQFATFGAGYCANFPAGDPVATVTGTVTSPATDVFAVNGQSCRITRLGSNTSSSGPFTEQTCSTTAIQHRTAGTCEYGRDANGYCNCAPGTARETPTSACVAVCQPAGEGQTAPTCGCQAGLTVVGGVCRSVNSCEANAGKTWGAGTWSDVQLPGGMFLYGTGAKPETTCVAGCKVTMPVGDTIMSNSSADGWNWTGWPTNTGQSCGAGVPVPTGEVAPGELQESEEYKCVAQGLNFGTVGGVVVCVPKPADTVSEKREKTETTNPDGSKTTVEKTTKVEPGKTTTTTTTTSNGTTSTVTEVKTGAGAGGGPGGEGEEPSTFGGTCGTGFQCSGDAVQCAIAKASWEHRCTSKWAEEANDLATDAETAIQAVKGIPEGDAQKALNKSGEFDLDLFQAYQDNQKSYVTFTSECVVVPPFQILGTTIDISTGPMCSFGTFVRFIMHLLAYLAVIRFIISKI